MSRRTRVKLLSGDDPGEVVVAFGRLDKVIVYPVDGPHVHGSPCVVHVDKPIGFVVV
jgi:hypothetical protein